MTRVVIDPGVLVSAFISPKKAAPALLVDAFLDGSVEVFVCPALIAELTDVLGRRSSPRTRPRAARRVHSGAPRSSDAGR